MTDEHKHLEELRNLGVDTACFRKATKVLKAARKASESIYDSVSESRAQEGFAAHVAYSTYQKCAAENLGGLSLAPGLATPQPGSLQVR
jgi:hypothetical protein